MEKLRGPRLFEREWIFLHLRLFVCVSTLLRQISSLGSKKKKMYIEIVFAHSDWRFDYGSE